MFRRLLPLLACSLATASHAQPTGTAWRVVAADSNASLVLPQLPSGVVFDVTRVRLNDATGAVSLGLTNTSHTARLWTERNGQLAPVMDLATAGALGPGRTGGEAGHIFRAVWFKQDGSQGGHSVFAARAGEATQPVDAATFGLWLWNGQRNTEVGRVNSPGALAPGFASDVLFTAFGNTTANTYPDAQLLANGRVLIPATVTGSRAAVTQHIPGHGNQGCALENSTDPDWSPDISADDYFFGLGSATFGTPVVGATAEVYMAADYRVGTSGTRRGIFRICDGAPRSLARTGEQGAFGPGLSDTSATFTELDRVRPATPGEVFFWGRGNGAGGAFIGGFHHANGLNRPLWLNGTDGAYGPGYTSYSFNQTGVPIMFAAGQYAVLNTTIRPAAGTTSIRGLWRLRPGHSPEPVAIVGDTGSFAPAPGRAWRSFELTTILDSGEILTLAEVSNPVATGVWRLRPGAAPERILAVGDLVSVPTATGVVERAITSISASYFDDTTPLHDSWVSRQGDVMARVNVQGITTTAQLFVRGRPGHADRMFQHAFD